MTLRRAAAFALLALPGAVDPVRAEYDWTCVVVVEQPNPHSWCQECEGLPSLGRVALGAPEGSETP